VLPSALIIKPHAKFDLGSAVLVGSTLGAPTEAVKRFLPSYARSDDAPELLPLTSTRTEINEIASTLQGKNVRVARTVVIASAADVTALPGLVQDFFPKAGVIHIAGHGIFDTVDGMASAMVLGGADPRGVLRAVDFSALDLKSVGLVVLSGCETGKVIVRQGQEALGFVRGLLVSGVQRAIVTQWVVSDEATALWFQRLYSRLADGEVIEQAYRETIVEMAAKYRHPFYWGGMTLYARQ
jgi:CHAT domain-containing protein